MSGNIAAFLTSRYDMAEESAHEDHVVGCGMHGARPGTGLDWREACDCRARRRLLDLDAMRRILAEHRQLMPGWCETCDVPGDYKGRADGCTTVRLLALPYADHPDYQDEWKP